MYNFCVVSRVDTDLQSIERKRVLEQSRDVHETFSAKTDRRPET